MAEVKRSTELVEYQAGSVVSRTLLKGSSGTVTLFAFDGGESLSEHTAPYDALLYVIDGEAQIGVSGETHRLGAGELIVLPANEPHSVTAVGRFKMMLTMIRS